MENLKRISIIGPNGSGKTTLARVLAKKLDLPIIHVDSYIWGKNWTLNDRNETENKIKTTLSREEKWIADGYITYAPKEMLEMSDLVIYLNYTNIRSVFYNIKRWIKHRKNKREELPEGCEEQLKLKSLYQVFQGGVVHLIEDAIKTYPPDNLVRIKSPSKLKKYLRENY